MPYGTSDDMIAFVSADFSVLLLSYISFRYMPTGRTLLVMVIQAKSDLKEDFSTKTEQNTAIILIN